MRNKALTVGVIALVFVMGLVVANPVAAQQGFTDFWSAVVMHSTLEVQGATNFTGGQTTTGAGVFSTYVQAADLKATDDADIADDARITGTVSAGDVSATTLVQAADVLATDDVEVDDDLCVADDARITGTLTAADGTFASTLDVTGDLNANSFLDLASSSVVTVTKVGGAGAAVIYTPTTSLVHLNSATAITITVGLVEAGRIVVFTGDDAVDILFPDSGNQALTGARTLQQTGSLTLLSIGTGWREIAFTDNN